MDDHIDHETLNGVKALMPAKFPDLVEKYLSSAIAYIGNAAQAAAKRDAQGVANSVHPLKSSSASLGLFLVAQLAQEIERLAESAESADRDWVSIIGGLEALDEAFTLAEMALRAAAGQ